MPEDTVSTAHGLDEDRFRGCLLGLAVGDAVGTTLEFKPRCSFEPLTDLVGGGPFHLPAGAWTDDTSMALCLAASLVAKRGFDARDQMDRYVSWHQEGYLSSTGRCFDIGTTTAAALNRYQQTHNPYSGSHDPHSAGNGSIMRLAPVVLFYAANPAEAIARAAESSRTTHGADECVDGCRLLAALLLKALGGQAKDDITSADPWPPGMDGINAPIMSSHLQAIAGALYRHKTADQVHGRGYVVDCLEAALWCFEHTSDYRSAVLAAANLGDDADTTAAVCGQIAGAYYGVQGIPAAWLAKLVRREEIEELASQLYMFATQK